MRITIVADDNAVNVDGLRLTVDCSDLPSNVHAIHWDGRDGEIEYRTIKCDHCGTRSKKPNEAIDDFGPYMVYAERWNVAKIAYDAAVKEAAEKQAAAEAALRALMEEAEAKRKEAAEAEAKRTVQETDAG